jgi:spore protease
LFYYYLYYAALSQANQSENYLERLATTIQLSDTGISPGSGMGNRRASLNRSTLGVPVVAIGIPTVVDVCSIAYSLAERLIGKEALEKRSDKLFETADARSQYFVTPKDTDTIISCLGKVIGYGINLAFHKDLAFEEMVSLSN